MYVISVHTLERNFVPSCRAASALRSYGMTYIRVFYITLNISDYADMLTLCVLWVGLSTFLIFIIKISFKYKITVLICVAFADLHVIRLLGL
jgi:hypothetical protein